ncbi:hypothetical protein [Limnobacter litoralis]|uniref:Transmembrane protein n=1 Tax=Limnobacter litoralis TaxID=481366 RepID=A0ABQ5YUF6_9BURK|nr:hypothetical protein [Limnobacter litoralis]GLR26936.1 hypothetical protein GCM10007875_20260 [Limnobacter litoralis]
MSGVHFSALTAKNDIVDESAIRNHIAKKAGYELRGQGSYQAIHRFDRFCNWVMGNTAVERYKRSYFESNQHAAAALVAARYRAVIRGEPADLNDDDTLKSRVYRNDFIRYNPGLRNGLRKSITGKQDPEKPFMTLGKSGRNRWAMFLTRSAHFTDGLNELAAAPTGLSVKISKLLITPTLKDHSLRSYARLLVCLPVIAIAVSAAIFGLVTKAMGDGWSAFAPQEAVKLLAKLDAVSGLLGGITYLLGLGSAALMKHDRLTDPMLAHIDNNRQRYMQRLVRVLRGAISQPGALHLLRRALNIHDKADSPRAALFNGLLDAVRANGDQDAAERAVERVLGRHFTLKNGLSDEGCNWLNAQQRQDRRTLASRERDFVKITNLLEHARTETHIGDDGFNNHRTNIEKGVAILRGKLDKLAASRSRVEKTRKLEEPFSVDRILSNPHQYAWWVRGGGCAAKLAYVLSFGVAMSTNYLLTRPFAAAHRAIEAKCTGGIHSRSLSFSFGRLVSGFAWAGIFFGCGNALSGIELFKLGGKVAVNISSTAVQMLGISAAGAVISAMLVGALKTMGGYKGDSKAPINYQKAPPGMPPVRWI